MKLQVRDMTQHLRLFNTMVEKQLFKKISYMKKPELVANMKKYFTETQHKGETIYVPKLDEKIKLSELKEKFYQIAPKENRNKKKEAPKKVEKKEDDVIGGGIKVIKIKDKTNVKGKLKYVAYNPKKDKPKRLYETPDGKLYRKVIMLSSKKK